MKHEMVLINLNGIIKKLVREEFWYFVLFGKFSYGKVLQNSLNQIKFYLFIFLS